MVIKGNLFEKAFNNEFDVIIQGNNCFNKQRRGISVLFVKHFQTDKYPMEQLKPGLRDKLGRIDYKVKKVNDKDLYVVNCYTQYHYGTNGVKVDYGALENCLQAINRTFKGMRIGMPWIGCGLAGGDKRKVLEIVSKTLVDCKWTIVEL